MRELRCGGCGRLLGTTTRTQAVPAQCTDPFCAAMPPASSNEERDGLIAHLVLVAGWPVSAAAEVFGLSRQRAQQVAV